MLMKFYRKPLSGLVLALLVFSALVISSVASPKLVLAYGNMTVDEAISIDEGTTHVTYHTAAGDDAWDQIRWYKFVPSETDWYLFQLSNPLYLRSENDTYMCLYSSYTDAVEGENYAYVDMEESRDSLSIVKKLESGQTYFLEIEISSDYGIDVDYSMDLYVTKTTTPACKISFEKDEYTFIFGEDDYVYLDLADSDDYDGAYAWASSDEDVVEISEEGYYYAELYLKNPGTAVISAFDENGVAVSCFITVELPPLVLSDSNVVFDSYDDYDNDVYIYIESEVSEIKTVVSSNAKVASAKKAEDEYGWYYAEVTPKSVGTAIVTITDQYGRSADVPITVTQKYIDESKYLEELSWSYVSGFNGSVQYGDTKLYCWCEIDANVYTTINGKKYTGSVDEDGYYIISGIPKLAAGKTVAVTFQKGEAKYTVKEKVQKKQGSSLKATVKAQVYSGKALKPTVTIKDGKTVLKEGVDYTVTYSSNKSVGKGKATVAFKGNYKGSKAVYFKINPKGTTLATSTAASKAITVKWKKQSTKMASSRITGYQIQLATDSKFTKNKKTVTVSGYSKTSKRISGLKGKKKYYIRIRTYKTVSGTKYYSPWSKVKTITTKA